MVRCPRCAHEGNPVQGKCMWCGSIFAQADKQVSPSTSPQPSGTPPSEEQPSCASLSMPLSFESEWERQRHAMSTRPLAASEQEGREGTGPLSPREPGEFGRASSLLGHKSVTRSDWLRNKRYRLLKELAMPANQRQQGTVWSALELKGLTAQRRVVVREIRVPEYLVRARIVSPEQLISLVVERCKELGRQPGFPQIIEHFQERGCDFLVLLYPDGETLAQRLKRQGGALPEDLVASYAYQLCGLLALLAEQQPALVHGAIAPETILLSDDLQTITLLHMPLFPPELQPRSSEQIAAGYAAPEQMRGNTLTPSSDLYSAAVCIHHAVTGYDPRTRLALFHPPARRLNPAVTPQMELILSRQLSLSPAQRYTSPAEIQRAFALLLESYPEPLSSELPVPLVDPLSLSSVRLRSRGKNTILLNMGVFAAVCALLLMGLLLFLLRT